MAGLAVSGQFAKWYKFVGTLTGIPYATVKEFINYSLEDLKSSLTVYHAMREVSRAVQEEIGDPNF